MAKDFLSNFYVSGTENMKGIQHIPVHEEGSVVLWGRGGRAKLVGSHVTPILIWRGGPKGISNALWDE
jgi:hypothetical protein